MSSRHRSPCNLNSPHGCGQNPLSTISGFGKNLLPQIIISSAIIRRVGQSDSKAIMGQLMLTLQFPTCYISVLVNHRGIETWPYSDDLRHNRSSTRILRSLFLATVCRRYMEIDPTRRVIRSIAFLQSATRSRLYEVLHIIFGCRRLICAD